MCSNENAEFHGCNLDDPNEVCHCTPELNILPITNGNKKIEERILQIFQKSFCLFTILELLCFCFRFSKSVLANAVSLLQNNCTYLNDFFAPDPTYIKDGVPDFAS